MEEEYRWSNERALICVNNSSLLLSEHKSSITVYMYESCDTYVCSISYNTSHRQDKNSINGTHRIDTDWFSHPFILMWLGRNEVDYELISAHWFNVTRMQMDWHLYIMKYFVKKQLLTSFAWICFSLTITASCPMNLQYFPMDRQLCHIEIESCKYATRAYVHIYIYILIYIYIYIYIYYIDAYKRTKYNFTEFDIFATTSIRHRIERDFFIHFLIIFTILNSMQTCWLLKVILMVSRNNHV